MKLNTKHLRFLRGGLLAAGAIATIGSLVAGVTHPAAAAGALGALITSVTCATTGTSACITGTNTSSGIGVSGTSNSGTGVRASSASNYGMKSTSNSSYGVYGTSGSSYGLFGSSTSGGAGVVGTTPSGYGVYGYTSGSSGYGLVGVEGSGGTGAYGSSVSGTGVEGASSSGYGVYAGAFGTGSGLYISAKSGYGIIAHNAGSVSVYATNTSGNGGDFQGSYIGLLGRSPSSGFPIVLTDSAANNLFYVDGAGNVSYKGGLFHFAATRAGETVKAFTSTVTAPTVEDTGTGQLVSGSAIVRLDPTFAASIETAAAYRVFLTPDGDTRGLFVATKTAAGFVVRESQGGRSTVTFDYRIVATSVGQAGQRMSVTSAMASSGPRAPLPEMPPAPPPLLAKPLAPLAPASTLAH